MQCGGRQRKARPEEKPGRGEQVCEKGFSEAVLVVPFLCYFLWAHKESKWSVKECVKGLGLLQEFRWCKSNLPFQVTPSFSFFLLEQKEPKIQGSIKIWLNPFAKRTKSGNSRQQ